MTRGGTGGGGWWPTGFLLFALVLLALLIGESSGEKVSVSKLPNVTTQTRTCYFWECPQCGAENEILRDQHDEERSCVKCGTMVYINPEPQQEGNWDQ